MKKRNPENQALPRGWRYRYGAYYYQVPAGVRDQWGGKTEYRLGRTLAEAHAAFAERVGYLGNVVTMEQLCDRYALEVIPNKAPATQRSNQYSLRRIRRAFAGVRVDRVRPKHVYAYRDATGRKESRKKANLDLEVLSHMFTRAIQWGLRDEHPMTNKKVEKFSLDHRKVMPLKADLAAFADLLPRKWQLYVTLKLWTGRRKGELLSLTKHDLVEDGIRFRNNKNPDDVFILAWEPTTRAIVQEILELPGQVRSVYLFNTRTGQAYIKPDGTTSGFDSIWQRYMAKAVKTGAVSVRFTEHDLRKVRASDLSADQAQNLLRHTSARMTERYRLGADVVDITK